ncbi:MAG TPA: SRPBCC domain-containing protein [Thermoplasmata archaeon]|nr:SRPBCC domain-containing protein [Thermoplasmata archaeon]
MTTPTGAAANPERELVLEHRFNAPAAKVFAAYTDPKLIPKWWAQAGGSFRVDVMEVRTGGRWRFVERRPDGREVAFSGQYLEVHPVTRLVYTFQVEGQPGSELTAAVDLHESAGVTRLKLTSTFPTKEIRDAMLSYGAAAGARASWERLAEAIGGVRT